MFDDCENLLQLNKKRIELIHKDDADIMQINKAYQERKKALQVVIQPFTKINFIRPVVELHKPYIAIPYAGESDTPGLLIYEQGGFKI